MDWILHVDTDELLYPGGAADYSLQRLLAAQPADVDNLVFPNWESMPERDDVTDPFTQVLPAAACLQPVRYGHAGGPAKCREAWLDVWWHSSTVRFRCWQIYLYCSAA